MSRSGSDVRQRTHAVGVRLLPDEYTSLTETAAAKGVSPAEVLRQAFTSLPRVESLAEQWALDRTYYPDSRAGQYAAIAVKLCERELRIALYGQCEATLDGARCRYPAGHAVDDAGHGHYFRQERDAFAGGTQ